MNLKGRMFLLKGSHKDPLSESLLLCLDDNPRCLNLALNHFTLPLRGLSSVVWFKEVFMDVDKHVEGGSIEEVFLEDLPLFISMKHRGQHFMRLLSGDITIDWIISRYTPYFKDAHDDTRTDTFI